MFVLAVEIVAWLVGFGAAAVFVFFARIAVAGLVALWFFAVAANGLGNHQLPEMLVAVEFIFNAVFAFLVAHPADVCGL